MNSKSNGHRLVPPHFTDLMGPVNDKAHAAFVKRLNEILRDFGTLSPYLDKIRRKVKK